MKLKKRTKFSRMRGTRYHGYAMKKHKGSGNQGGKGMAGSGKRADQKKTKIIKLYGNSYFGKESMKRKTKKIKVINVGDIKPTGKEINLEKFKVLGRGEVKEKLIIKAKAFSKTAKSKIEKAGG
ncbi:MAG: uL15m family ribosomal protein, partial [Nanoarchaeota archaeon]|nr:uL15 family ribosomal protein [Nanoarchaeota archaeon]